MTAKPKTRKAAANGAELDRVFAAITEHKAREKECIRLNDNLDEAQFQAEETHGRRPEPLIWWRNCDVFSRIISTLATRNF